MKISYDKEVRALYIQIADGNVGRTVEVRQGVIADFGADGQLLGVEILNEEEFLSFLSSQDRGEFSIPQVHAL